MSDHPIKSPTVDANDDRAIVYVREADRSALPEHLQETPGKFFALHDLSGTCLAVTQDRKVAFDLARQNDLRPVSVH
ncbi:MAG: DUF1150 family protein [Paracoccaceae bacterium]